jgi:hypothetical protein
MSTSLLYSPGASDRTYTLYFELKYRLAPKIFGHDGTLGSPPEYLNKSHIPMLVTIARGAGNDDTYKAAKRLINSIRKHGYVKVWLER